MTREEEIEWRREIGKLLGFDPESREVKFAVKHELLHAAHQAPKPRKPRKPPAITAQEANEWLRSLPREEPR